MQSKICKRCQVEHPVENFYRTGVYLQPLCKPCHNEASKVWAKTNPDAVKRIRRKTKLKEKYGLSPEQYEQMSIAQGDVCKLCFKHHPRRPLNVDHCHTTGMVRGLLCDKCNMALGLFGDDIETLQRTINYLKETS